MKQPWLVLVVIIVFFLSLGVGAIAETCRDYEIHPGFPYGYLFGEAIRYHAIASRDGFAYVCLIDGTFRSYPVLMCLELGPTVNTPPVSRSQTGLPTSSSRTFLVDDYALMAMGFLGLGVVDISNPDLLSGVVLTETADVVKDLAVLESGYAVTSEWNALRVYDLQNPVTPVQIAEVFLTQARTLAVTQELAFVACGNLGLAIVEISNPTAPYMVTQFPVGGHVDQIAVAGNRVYLTGYLVGMMSVDVSTPAAPIVIDTLPLEGEPERIVTRDGYAYILVDEAITVIPELPDFDAMALVRLNPTATPSLVDYFFLSVDYASIALGEDRVFLGEFEASSDLVMASLQCPDLSDVPPSPALALSLSAPWPNPFNPRVNLRFSLPDGVSGHLTVHDLRGNLVAEIWRGTGNGLEAEAIWNGNDRRGQACPSGTYGFMLTDQGGKHSTRVTGTLLR